MYRYYIIVFQYGGGNYSAFDPNGYENLGFAQILALEFSKSSKGIGVIVEYRIGDEVMSADLFSNGRKSS